MTNLPMILVYLVLLFLCGFQAGLHFRHERLPAPAFDEPVEERVIEMPLKVNYQKEGRWN